MVASVRSGRRTGRRSERSALKACGEGTSCTRCRSMYRTAGVSAVSGTTSCAFQIFSNSVLGVIASPSSLGGLEPGHSRAQLRTDFFDRMVEIDLQELGVLATAALRLGHPLPRAL